jgi:phosphatidylglycerophosphatase A
MAADTTTSPLRPDFHFLGSHPAHAIALGFGAGLSPVAPGTAGTLVSAVVGFGLCQVFPPLDVALLSIPLFILGVWACGVTGRDLGVHDHGSMVWDEIVAFLPLAAFASGSLLTEAACVRPLSPVRYLEAFPDPPAGCAREGRPWRDDR